MKISHIVAAGVLFLGFLQPTFAQLFELDTATGIDGTGHLGANGFTFAGTGGGSRITNVSLNNGSAAFMNSTFTAPHAAFDGISFPTGGFGYGRTDSFNFGFTDGNVLTVNFDTPQSDLVVLLSNLDGNWQINLPFSLYNPGGSTLAVNGSGQLYSTIYDGSIPSFNKGVGAITFASPVSTLTFTKVGGPADDFSFGMAAVPEPSSMMISSLGLLTLGMRRRRA